MDAVLKFYEQFSIHEEIECHSAWAGYNASGLAIDKMLRGKKPFTYILRGGEHQNETEKSYYVSFVRNDGTIAHVPFIVYILVDGWYYQNTGMGGPYNNQVSIENVLPRIMHCGEQDVCTPMRAS